MTNSDATNQMPTVASLIASALKRHGVTLTFGQSLPTMVQLANTDIGIRQIAYRTENAGAAMADGYARVARRIGIVTAQNGPAATLLVPGLAEAQKSSVPILAIVQDVPRSTTDKNAFQEFDHVRLFQACTKWAQRIDTPERVEDTIDLAITVATTGRPGPVALIVPSDLLLETLEPSKARTAAMGQFPLDRTPAAPGLIAEAVRMLADAETPMIIAGGGVHLSGAHGVLADLQELASLPVATTTMGKGAVDETHGLSLGVVGNAMGRQSRTHHMRSLIERADVLLLVGTRTNQNGTDSWSLFPRPAKFIHIDVDGIEVGRNYEALRLIGDARETLAALVEGLRNANLSRRREARSNVESAIRDALDLHRAAVQDVVDPERTPMRPERLMADLDEILDPRDIVVADASYSSVWTSNGLTSRSAGARFITPRGLAGLGWGFPMALGAKLARPDVQVFCIVGDGGFGHCWQELETAKRSGINVIVTVLNNGILGYQRDAEDVKFGRHTDACAFEPVDHAKIAEACGCIGIKVEHPSEYKDALRKGIDADRPTLIEVITDPLAYPPLTMFDEKLDEVRCAT